MGKIGLLMAALLLLTFTVMAANPIDIGKTIIGTYTIDDQIYVNTIGVPEGRPITSGHMDYKPVWSKTSDRIVFFRIKRYSPNLQEWRNAICVVNTDGSGFRELTDGKHLDVNPTWMRDGSDRIVFVRYSDGNNTVCLTTPDAKPGDERVISDPSQSIFVHACLPDGRLFVTRTHGTNGDLCFLYKLGQDLSVTIEPVRFAYKLTGRPERASFSPSGRKIAYELNFSFLDFHFSNHPLVIADFDPATATCSNPVVFTHAWENVCDMYPRWVKDESAVIYTSNRSGKWQLYMYTLADRKTRRVSTQGNADYKYFCAENCPY